MFFLSVYVPVVGAVAGGFEMYSSVFPQDDPGDGAAVCAGQHGPKGWQDKGDLQGHSPISIPVWGGEACPTFGRCEGVYGLRK